jgi:hypothetical protein
MGDSGSRISSLHQWVVSVCREDEQGEIGQKVEGINTYIYIRKCTNSIM